VRAPREGTPDVARAVTRAVALALTLALPLLFPAVATPGCSHPPPDATPEGALRLFLDDMEDSDDPTSMRRAYDLLGPAAQASLVARAHSTSLLQGRHFEPWDMLAAGLFGLAFRTKAMRAAVVGDRATVDVYGEDPGSEHASVICTHVGAGWRIEPDLPEP
jgi:hypothetical protein